MPRLRDMSRMGTWGGMCVTHEGRITSGSASCITIISITTLLSQPVGRAPTSHADLDIPYGGEACLNSQTGTLHAPAELCWSAKCFIIARSLHSFSALPSAGMAGADGHPGR